MEAHARSTEKLSPPRPSNLFGPVIFEMSPLESRGSFGRVLYVPKILPCSYDHADQFAFSASNWTAFTEKVCMFGLAILEKFDRA